MEHVFIDEYLSETYLETNWKRMCDSVHVLKQLTYIKVYKINVIVLYLISFVGK